MAIRDTLRADGHEFANLVNLGHHREAFLAGAPMILDGYAAYSRFERNAALMCLQARIPSRPLALRLHALLVAEDPATRDITAHWCAGRALVGLCGRDRDLMLEFAGDERLGQARCAIIEALAKRRDLRVVPLVEQALRDPPLRRAGLDAIGFMRLHAFAPEVHDSLYDANPANREGARNALKRLQDGKT